MTKPVRHRFRPNHVANCIQARRYAAAAALFVATACAQEPPAPDNAQTRCATLDFFLRERAFNLDSSSHMDLKSTPIQVVLRRQARPRSEPIRRLSARAQAGGTSPPGAGAPAAKPAEPQSGEAPAGMPWFFTLMKRLDCAWAVDFDPHETTMQSVRLRVRVRTDGLVESVQVISAYGDPANKLAAFRANALAAIQRASPFPGPNALLDRIVEEGLDVIYEVRGFKRNLRAAIPPR